MPSWFTIKLGAMVLGGVAILSFVLLAFHWKHQASDRGDKLAVICQATRDGSGNPKLKCSEVPAQIKFMGETIGTLTTAVHKQNDAIAAMGAENKRQQAEGEKASQAAGARAQTPQAASGRLTASSLSSERLAKPCVPSKELTEGWK